MKIALLYGSNTGQTARVAELVRQSFGPELIEAVADLRHLRAQDLQGYDVLILGAPTWYIGELQDDWARIASALAEVDLSGTRVALFGLGDQRDYPDHFVDALGHLHDLLAARGAQTGFGSWSLEGYAFDRSCAVRAGRFCGLALDQGNQRDETPLRVAAWCTQLRRELGLAAAGDDPLRAAHAA